MLSNKWFWTLGCFLIISFGTAQSNSSRQRALEGEKKRLQQEIKQINTLLFDNSLKEKSFVSQVEDLDLKISVRSQLVKVNNQQANLLTRQINVNQRDITKLRSVLKDLKKDYADMITNSYKSKSSLNRLMFLFSSKKTKHSLLLLLSFLVLVLSFVFLFVFSFLKRNE